MKLEKVNDNQIRCTLTKADLADRQLKISELAYGTEKAKTLFRDMMQQAAYEFGFEAEDIPLMIEAIPISGESILLIITKVEDPEELDTRFSNFAPSIAGNEDFSGTDNPLFGEALQTLLDNAEENIRDLVKKISSTPDDDNMSEENNTLSGTESKKAFEHKQDINDELVRAFAFSTLDEIENFSKVAVELFNGSSWLYKDKKQPRYLLYLSQGDERKEDFNRLCNIASEYGKQIKGVIPDMNYLDEQNCLIIKGNAINKLAEVSK